MLVSHSFEFVELLTVDTVMLIDSGLIVRTGDIGLFLDIKKTASLLSELVCIPKKIYTKC